MLSRGNKYFISFQNCIPAFLGSKRESSHASVSVTSAWKQVVIQTTVLWVLICRFLFYSKASQHRRLWGVVTGNIIWIFITLMPKSVMTLPRISLLFNLLDNKCVYFGGMLSKSKGLFHSFLSPALLPATQVLSDSVLLESQGWFWEISHYLKIFQQ